MAMLDRVESNFDFRSPDYAAVFRARAERVGRIRTAPSLAAYAMQHYRGHLTDFILDWGTITEPRAAGTDAPTFMPFILWPRQVEFIEWVIELWRTKRDGVVPKSRDSGATWMAVAMACSLCMLHEGVNIGFGSRREDYVDKKGAPRSIFEKIRAYMRHMPQEFTGGWNEKAHSPAKLCYFPGTRSTIVGDIGDEIGRGDRCTLYFVDEAAYIEHPEMADQALAGTTNCRVDISTPCGMANSFARKCHDGKTPRFDLHWRFDPRKDEEWYARQVAKYDAVTVAQEIDMNFAASAEGIILPSSWVAACIDAHLKLPQADWTGVKRGALDVADEGTDLNAFAARHGNLITECVSWSGAGSDIFATAERAFILCDALGLEGFDYDADGLGAGVRGDSVRIAERRAQTKMPVYKINPYRGSGGVTDPERLVPGTEVKNEDRWQNYKAQAWGAVAERARNTFRAISGETEYDRTNLLSISSKCAELTKAVLELSTPQWKISTTGKIMVDKTPNGAKSPNLADAIVMVLFGIQKRRSVFG